MSNTPEEKFQKLVKEGKNRKHDNGIDRTLQLCNFDEHQIDLGCQTFHKHFFSMFVTMLTGKVIDTISTHTTYIKNNNMEKCAGMGLNGFHIK